MLAALAGLTLLSAGPAAAQGIGHTWFMRGSIVGADEFGPVVCNGKTDGADVGQVLEAYRNVRVPGASASKRAGTSYRRRFAGRVRIDHVYDDHFARVTGTEGNPAKHDIVELRKN